LGAFGEGPVAGVASMGLSMPSRAPGLTWIGAPFALLADFFGRPEPALLMAVLACQAATLLAIYYCGYLASGRRTTAAAVAAFFGSTPIFVGLSHHYLVEPVQTLAVALSFLLALCARRLSRWGLCTALLAALAFALSAKSTSLLYCGLPLLFCAVVLVRHPGSPPSQVPAALRVAVSLAVLGGAGLILDWYAVHYENVLLHAIASTVGPIAQSYGTQDPFLAKLGIWIAAFASALFFPSWLIPLAAGAAGIAAAALPAGRRLWQPPTPSAPLPEAPWITAAAAVHMTAALAVYSLQINDDPRFLEPLLPAAALLSTVALARLGRAFAGMLLVAALTQFLLSYGYALGLSPKGSNHFYLWVAERNATKRDRLEKTVALTCDPEKPYDINFVGVQYSWLSAASANFYAVAANKGRVSCPYVSLEDFIRQPDRALNRLHRMAHRYFITVAPDRRPPPSWDAPDFVNTTLAEAFALVSSSEDWEYVGSVADTIVIFRSKSLLTSQDRRAAR
jgi:hypothetical protein